MANDMGMEGFGNFDDAFEGFSQFSFDNKEGKRSQQVGDQRNYYEKEHEEYQASPSIDHYHADFSQNHVESSRSDGYNLKEQDHDYTKKSSACSEKNKPKMEIVAPSLATSINQPKKPQVEVKAMFCPIEIKGKDYSSVRKIAEQRISLEKECKDKNLEHQIRPVITAISSEKEQTLPNPSTVVSCKPNDESSVHLHNTSTLTFEANPPTRPGSRYNPHIDISLTKAQQPKPTMGGSSGQSLNMITPIDPKLCSPKKEIQPGHQMLIQRPQTKTPLIIMSAPFLKPIDGSLKIEAKKDCPSIPNNSEVRLLPKKPIDIDPVKTLDQPTSVPAFKPIMKIGGVNLMNKATGSNFIFGNLGLGGKLEDQKKIVKLNPCSEGKVNHHQNGYSTSVETTEGTKNILNPGVKSDIPKNFCTNNPLDFDPPIKEKLNTLSLVGNLSNKQHNVQPSVFSIKRGIPENQGQVVKEKALPSEFTTQRKSNSPFTSLATEEINKSFKQMRSEVLNVQENLVKGAYLVKRIHSLKSYLGLKFRDTEKELKNLGVRL